MLFVIDLDTLYVIEAARDKRPVSSVSGKRGDGVTFQVQFVRSGVAEELPTDSVLTFGAKESAKYDAAAVVLHSDFTLSGSGETAVYSGSPSFNTVALNALLFIDDDDSNDPEYVDLMAEFTWQVADGAPTSTKTFRFRVHNDVVRDDEITPSALAPVWGAPLARTAPPTDGTLQMEQILVVATSGITANGTCPVVVTGAGIAGSPLTVPVALTTASHTSGLLIMQAIRTALLAVDALTELWDLEAATGGSPTGAMNVYRNADAANDATFSIVIPTGLGIVSASSSNTIPGVAGTAATAKGQLAIVTTTNDSGTFEDIWTCSNLVPMTWQPPGNIFRDRTSGTLYRVFYDSAAPDTEEAYP